MLYKLSETCKPSVRAALGNGLLWILKMQHPQQTKPTEDGFGIEVWNRVQDRNVHGKQDA